MVLDVDTVILCAGQEPLKVPSFILYFNDYCFLLVLLFFSPSRPSINVPLSSALSLPPVPPPPHSCSLQELEADLTKAGVVTHLVGGADVASELDAKRAIDQVILDCL